MTRALLYMVLAIVLLPLPSAASEVLVVQSVRSKMYDEALSGFRSACPAEISTLVLSDYADPELARVIQEERPRLLVAIGDTALAALRKVRKTPVLALMALRISNREEQRSNVAGVGLLVHPEKYLSLFKKMRARKIGVVYDPSRTGGYVQQARTAARQQGLELVLREVSHPRQAMAQLASLRGAVDSLWLLPDATAVTGETLEGYLLFAQGQSIPVVSFSAAHLKLGALAAIEADRVESGRQGGELAEKLLQGAQPAELALSPPRKVSIRANEAVAKRLNIPAELLGPCSKK